MYSGSIPVPFQHAFRFHSSSVPACIQVPFQHVFRFHVSSLHVDPSIHVPTVSTSALIDDPSLIPSAYNGAVAETSPPLPLHLHVLQPVTPTSVERMDSATSTGSASRYYSTYMRTPSGGTPLSRSDSGSSSEGLDRSRKIQEEVRLFEIVSWSGKRW
jgi:hypothetical protein